MLGGPFHAAEQAVRNSDVAAVLLPWLGSVLPRFGGCRRCARRRRDDPCWSWAASAVDPATALCGPARAWCSHLDLRLSGRVAVRILYAIQQDMVRSQIPSVMNVQMKEREDGSDDPEKRHLQVRAWSWLVREIQRRRASRPAHTTQSKGSGPPASASLSPDRESHIRPDPSASRSPVPL